jgi:hypothetical protein
MGIDLELQSFILRNMGPPYADPGYTGNRSPRLPLKVRGKKYPITLADISGSHNLETRMVNFIVTLERFIGLDTLPLGEDQEGGSDINYWHDKPVNTWPRDDAEAKLIAVAIATCNYNNYIAPKKYRPLPWDDPDEISSFFKVRNPLFIPGMAWKGTRPSFYKISIGRDLVKAVSKGRYPHKPTMVDKYTPVLPENPPGGMDKLWFNAMKPLANRRIIIGCLGAFKMFFTATRFSGPPGVRI